MKSYVSFFFLVVVLRKKYLKKKKLNLKIEFEIEKQK